MTYAPDDIIVPLSPDLRHVLEEAREIAEATSQPVTSHHVLLAFFVSRNPAERLLRSREVDEDRLLALVDPEAKEPRAALREVVARGSQVAAGCGAREVDCLHVLVAMTRHRQSTAYRMLSRADPKLGHLRTRALTILTGAVPRWMSRRNRPDRADRSDRLDRGEATVAVSRPPIRGERSRRPAITWTPPLVAQAPHGRKLAIPRRRSDASRKRSSVPAAAPSRPIRPGAAESPRSRPEVRPGRGRSPATAEPLPAPSLADGTPSARAGRVRPAPRPGSPPDVSPMPSASTPNVEPPPHAAATPHAKRGPAPHARPGAAPQVQPGAARPVSPKPSDKPQSSVDIDVAAPWMLDPESYPWLTSLGRNLSAAAARGEVDRLVGRETEIETLIDVLGKRRSNNPVLIGEPGVGKTAVVEGLAARLVQDDLHRLGRKILIVLDVGALLVGTHLRGSFSEKMQGVKEEVRRSRGRIIVFFDELHTLIGAGSTGDGPQDAAHELKTALARGHFPCIGATTFDEYKQHIEPDPALARRFVPVLVKELSPDQTIEMLQSVLPAYARHHKVWYRSAAIQAAVDLSVRYMTDRFLPDKAITLLDLGGSRAARRGQKEVDRPLIAELVAERCDLPVERLLGSDAERLLQLERLLAKAVVGQTAALARIATVIRRNAAGFRGARPAGSLLFVGPTGVGKTQTAKALARILHGNEDALLRVDLSEFGEAHSTARLVGAPPGYVGHDAGGQLTEAVRRRPGRVVLFDELEKAHPDVLQLLLQVLDDGRLTDGRGRTVSFTDCLIIMTSNLGVDGASRGAIGFGGQDGASNDDRVLDAARRALAPELWGRIEEKLVFQPLQPAEIRQIAALLSEDSSARLTRERGISYALDDRAIDFMIAQGGHDLRHGARPMRQVLSRLVEAPIAQRILEGRLRADEHVQVSTRADGSLIFRVEDGTSLSQRPPIR